jgi:ABC-2 type transport system permease protein
VTVTALDAPLGPTSGPVTGARVNTGAMLGRLVHRSYLNTKRIPVSVVPLVVMPIFFTVAFSGTFRGLTQLPGYPTDNIYNWMVPYACVQTASFGALGAAFGLGRDLETGFYDRLLLSPAQRWVVPASGILWSLARTALPLAITLTIGTLGGMTYPGGPMAVVWLAVAAGGVAVMGSLWSLGVMYRAKKQSAGGLVQVGLFVAMFLSVGTVPLELMEGWLPHVARYNPVTPILTLARAGFVGTGAWSDIWPGLVAIALSSLLLGWFAERGMRTLVP